MTPAARDALTVFLAGDELPGVIAYGLGSHDRPDRGRFPTTAWPARSGFDEFVLHGEAWSIVGWEVALADWPRDSQWRTAVADTLRAHLDAGCRVAWIGAEGVPFCEPPQLFDPTCMSGGVLAWMTEDKFECPLDPDGPLVPVGDDQLRWLRRHAAGLADAP